MPTVPTKITSEVANRPISTVYQDSQRATLDVFGGAQANSLIEGGKKLAGASDQLAQMAIRQQIEDNEREAKALDVELSERTRSIVYGDGTAGNPGFYNLNGEAAVAAAANTQAALDKAAAELGGKAKNSRSKQLFEDAALTRIADEKAKIGSHASKQRLVAADTTSAARIKEAQDDAAAAWNDPEIVARSTVIVEAETRERAKRAGLSEEATQSAVQSEVSNVIRAQVMAALQVDPDKAYSIYQRSRNLLDGTARAEMDQMVNEMALADRSQKVADAVVAQFGVTGSGYDQGREEIKATTNGKVRDAALQRYEHEHAIAMDKVQERRAADAANRAAVSFNLQMQDRAVIQDSLGKANSILEKAPNRGDAFAALSGIEDARMRDAVRERLAQHFGDQDRAVAETSLKMSDTIISTSVGRVEAMRAVDKIKDPSLHDATRDRVVQHFADMENASDAEKLGVAQTMVDGFKARGLSFEQMVEEARTIKDARLREAALAQVDQQRKIKDRADEQAKDEAFGQAHRYINEGGTVAEFLKTHPQFYNIMTRDGIAMGTLYTAEDRRAKGETFARTSDGKTLATVYQDNPTPQQMAKLDPIQYRPLLTESEFNRFVEDVNGAKARLNAVQEDTGSYNTAISLLKNYAPTRLAKKWDGAGESEGTRQVRVMAEAEMTAWVAQNLKQGKKPSREEMDAEARRLMTHLYEKHSAFWNFFNDNDRVVAQYKNMTPEQQRRMVVPMEEIAPDLLAGIEKRAKENKIKITDDLVESAAAAIITGDRQRLSELGLGKK